MEPEKEKTSILETFIKYTVLFYLALIINGYLCILCYYSFFGVSSEAYFKIDDYIHEIFTSWIFLSISAVLYFFTVIYLKYTEKYIFQPSSDKSQPSLLANERVNKLLIIIVSSLAVVWFGSFITYHIVTGSKKLTFYMFYGVPTFLTIILYLSLHYYVNFKSLKMTKIKLSLITFIFGILLFNLAKYVDVGYTTLNEKSIDLKRTFHLNTGAVITTSDTVLYLGSSKEYIFIFDRSRKKAFIYNRSTVLYTEVDIKKIGLTK
jgi:hypothetical protein